ncbi:MAG: trigger factor [Microcystaceae cyanobacterium]
MKVTQEKLPDSQVSLQIEVPPSKSQQIYEKIVQDLAKTTNLPGFRKGKIPRQILIQQLGASRVKAYALEELIKVTLEDVIEDQDITALGNYEINPDFEQLVQTFIPGTPFVFSATLDVPPEVEVLGDYVAIAVKAEETVYDPERVDNWLKERQGKMADLVPVEDRPAQFGDTAIIDFQGYFLTEAGDAGEGIEKVQGTDFKAELEDGKLVEGMVEGIIGMAIEENKDVIANFPADYPLEEVAGQQVLFKITLKELKTRELPELDDDFAQEVSDVETITELRELLEKRFQEEAKAETDGEIGEAILDRLVETSTIPLPKVLIEEEISEVLQNTAMQMQQMGLDINLLFNKENVPQLRETARPEAMERLKKGLILSKIGELEKIAPDPEKVAERFAELKERFDKEQVDPVKLTAFVVEELTAGEVLDWLRGQASVELVAKGTLHPPESDDDEVDNDEVIDVEATAAD